MFDLLEAEWGVAEINELIERQRLLIEQLGYEGYDTTSARTVFDSLLVSLALYLQERHRLPAVLNSKEPKPTVRTTCGCQSPPRVSFEMSRARISEANCRLFRIRSSCDGRMAVFPAFAGRHSANLDATISYEWR